MMEIVIKVVAWAASILVLTYILIRVVMSTVNNEAEIGDNIADELLAEGLNVYSDANHKHVLISESPNEKIINETIDGLGWTYISFVTLVFSDSHFIEVSGSIEDGFCAKYRKNEMELFAEPPPRSTDELKNILNSFMSDVELSVKKYNFT